MRCSRFHHDIALWVTNDLGGWRTRRLQHHLSRCPGCRQYAESFRRHQATIKQHAAVPIDPALAAGLVETVMARIQQPVQKPRPARNLARRFAALAAGLAIATASACGLYAWAPWHEPATHQPVTTAIVNPIEQTPLPRPAPLPIQKPAMVKLMTDDPNVIFVMLSD